MVELEPQPNVIPLLWTWYETNNKMIPAKTPSTGFFEKIAKNKRATAIKPYNARASANTVSPFAFPIYKA